MSGSATVRIVDLDADTPAERTWRSIASEVLAATLEEDHIAATHAIAALAAAGVVAIRTPAWIFELRETRPGWVLVATRGAADPHDLAAAAAVRHARLDTRRRRGR